MPTTVNRKLSWLLLVRVKDISVSSGTPSSLLRVSALPTSTSVHIIMTFCWDSDLYFYGIISQWLLPALHASCFLESRHGILLQGIDSCGWLSVPGMRAGTQHRHRRLGCQASAGGDETPRRVTCSGTVRYGTRVVGATHLSCISYFLDTWEYVKDVWGVLCS